jgi:hypothetical protein
VAAPAVLILSALVALGGALRFYGLARQGFWYDEANTAYLVHLSPGGMLGLLPKSESTPPLYYCVAWVWVRLFGDQEAGLRSLSALIGVLIIPLAYKIGTVLVTRRVGLVLAALVTFNPFLIWYSQEARAYELLVLFTSLALLSLAVARPSRGPWPLAGWSLSSVLALLTHYYAVVAVTPQAIWLLLDQRRRRGAQMAVAAVLVCGAGLLPLALTQNATGHDRWIANSPLSARLRQIFPQFLIGTGAPDRLLIKWLAFAAVAVAVGLLALRGDAGERRPALFAAVLAVSGLALSIAFVLLGFDDLITRNLIALLLPGAVVLACGLGARRAGVLGLLAAATLCGLGIEASVGVAADRGLQRPDWRPVAHLLGPRPAPGTPGHAILIQHYRTLLPLSLYLPGLRDIKAHAPVIDQLDVISIRSPSQPLCWWGAACNLIPSALQASYPIPGLRPVWRRQIRQFTIERFVAPHPVRLSRRMVARGLSSTRLGHDDLLVER